MLIFLVPGGVEVAEDALASASFSIVAEQTDSNQSTPVRRITEVDLTEPMAPVVVETGGRKPKPKPDVAVSPSKADKILALISEIGANQMLNNMEDFHPWFWEQSPGKLINI